jgi:D-serine deaminase-like pyridoxal phosphate-dependent protein
MVSRSAALLTSRTAATLRSTTAHLASPRTTEFRDGNYYYFVEGGCLVGAQVYFDFDLPSTYYRTCARQ